MDCLDFIVFFIMFPLLQSCPEPLTVHIQNYDGPIIVHSATADSHLYNQKPCNQQPCNEEPCNQQPCNQQPCNQQPCNQQPCNQQPCHHHCNQYETECTCITKQCGYYQPTGYYQNNGYCSVEDGLKPAIYVVEAERFVPGYGLSYNKYGSNNCLCGKCGGYY